MQPVQSITIISSPYHFGAEVAVGGGPRALLAAGLRTALRALGVSVDEIEIPPADDTFEGEVGKSFELLRRTSRLVTDTMKRGSLPIILTGNCTTTVGVSAGVSASGVLGAEELSCIWFDAHDDINTPSVLVSGYLDAMAISVLSGQCWESLVQSIPGFKNFDLNRLIHVGMRDVTEVERRRVEAACFPVVWGNANQKVDFASETQRLLATKKFGPTMVHLDLDCLDASIGPVNKWPSAGGLLEADLVGCLDMVPRQCHPVSLTVAGFDPSVDIQGNIPPIAIKGIVSFAESMIAVGHLVPTSTGQKVQSA